MGLGSSVYDSRCPIHGNITFSERERRIIDHPFCQRLRAITQLGFASLVYVGATHSRLNHSMGVMHLAGRIFDRIVAGEDQTLKKLFCQEDLLYFRQIVRFAALLHDIGHPPFSHSAESILPPKHQLELPLDWYQQVDTSLQATHEDFTIAIIYSLSLESSPVLDMDEARDICSLIDANITPSPSFEQRCRLAEGPERNIYPLMRHIISGEVDADRMDYLHRDSHYAGVSYGVFDLDRMVRSLSCTPTEQGIVLTLNQSAIYTYEDYLLARYHMFMQVYFHKTLLPFDHYLQQALKEKEIDLQITGDLDNYLMQRDYTVMGELWKARDCKWSQRIVDRKPLKKLFQFEHYHSEGLDDEMQRTLSNAGIEHLLLESTGYLSILAESSLKAAPLLLKQQSIGKTTYRSVHEVSRLLKQYHPTVNVKYLYCQHEDYEDACRQLQPLIN